MNLLDENFPADQRALLRAWRIPFREIGRHASSLGIKDDNILPLLHTLRRVTFFTQDEDFFVREYCHSSYCLAWLDIKSDDVAYYARRFLRHPRFKTNADRMGIVARAFQNGIHFWQRGTPRLQRTPWPLR